MGILGGVLDFKRKNWYGETASEFARGHRQVEKAEFDRDGFCHRLPVT